MLDPNLIDAQTQENLDGWRHICHAKRQLHQIHPAEALVVGDELLPRPTKSARPCRRCCGSPRSHCSHCCRLCTTRGEGRGRGPGRGGGGGGVGRWRRIWWVAAAHSVQRRWIWSAAGRGRRRVGRVCAGSGLGACVRVGRARSRVGIKRIFFFENTLCREAQRETGSRQRNRLVSFLQTSFAQSQPVRLSANNLCRGPYGQALGK